MNKKHGEVDTSDSYLFELCQKINQLYIEAMQNLCKDLVFFQNPA
jgi:hypothetical protein